MGGRQTLFGYDSAGRLTARYGAERVRYSYLDTGLVASVTTGTPYTDAYTDFDTLATSYAYDALGKTLRETGVRASGHYGYDPDYQGSHMMRDASVVLQDATASYDALGRMTDWSDIGSASKHWSYDAVGNVRRVTATFRYLDANGAPSSAGAQDDWYAYDAMNRVTVSQGTLAGGQIVRGTQGVALAYDAAGQRRTATHTVGLVAHGIYDPYATVSGRGRKTTT